MTMTQTISNHEMQQRQAMARAKSDMTEVMSKHELTALEWLNVLNEMAQRMVLHGLREEWNEP